MELTQLTLDVDAEQADAVEGYLSLAGAIAVTLSQAGGAPLFEPPVGATPLWPRVRVCGLFQTATDMRAALRLLETRLALQSGIELTRVSEADWTGAIAAPADPQIFGARLALVPAASRMAIDGRITVKLNMGLAFGTGRHPTTALCLEWLDAARLTGTKVLDFGCGSGILAIAALKLGAARVWATDNDPQALLATRGNAMLNGVERRLWSGPAGRIARLSPDLLLANILAGALIELADKFTRSLRSGGRIVLSGILDGQVETVVGVYERAFCDFEIVSREGWARIVARRR